MIDSAALILQLVIALITVFVVYRRSKVQAIVDDSTAAINYQSLVVKLQGEVRVLEMEVRKLKDAMDQSDLVLEMIIPMLGAPIVKAYKWRRSDELEKRLS